jgi:hypothetical protein
VWVGHLLLHRVEALVSAQKPACLDSFPLFVLKAMALNDRDGLEGLDGRLHLGRSLLRQIVRRLEMDKLVEPTTGGSWSLTAMGRQTAELGGYLRPVYERRAFSFVENEQTARSPHFLNIPGPPDSAAWGVPEGWQFDVTILEACLRQPHEWKQRHNFPLDVQEILGPTPASSVVPGAPPVWQRVILDRPEHLLALLVLTSAADKEHLIGFAVQQDGWLLRSEQPAFILRANWEETFPDLAVPLPLDLWRQAWRAWSQPRGLPPAEVEGCILERHSYLLCIRAPRRFLERLQRQRSDALKGETWLLAGTGRLRSAALVELSERVKLEGGKRSQ